MCARGGRKSEGPGRGWPGATGMALVALAGREGPARGVWGSGRWECVYVLASAERVGELHVRMYYLRAVEDDILRVL